MPREAAEQSTEGVSRNGAADLSCYADHARRETDEMRVLEALMKGEGDAAAVARRSGVGLEKAAAILAELACSPLVWMSMARKPWRFRLSELGRAAVRR